MSTVNPPPVDWSTLPAPVDDGAAAHLAGMPLPALSLPSTDGEAVRLDTLAGTIVLYLYPMTGAPGVALPEDWDAIPGARGCTPQSCSFRDHFAELRHAGADHVFGVSMQIPEEQREAHARLKLPFQLLSDAEGWLAGALSLPTFEAGGRRLLKRMALIARGGKIAAVFYPVFPPDRNAADVLAWLESNPG